MPDTPHTTQQDEEAAVLAFETVVAASRLNVVVSFAIENYNEERLRAFGEIHTACFYVERLAARLNRLCDLGRTEMYVASATVYEITPTGKMRVFESFDGHDRGDGVWVGWDDEQ